MAQYPTNAFAKADIANGATSDASDVNDLAHEITAITDGLLNGTARLNSSNTTTNNFQAGGNSTLNAVTLRGALIPTGSSGLINLQGTNLYGSTAAPNPFLRYDSTLAGWQVSDNANTKLQIAADGNVTLPLQPRCSVFNSAVQAISSGAGAVALTFDSELFDVGGFHSTGSNPSRLTVPAGSSGLYSCYGQVFYNTLSTVMNLRLLKNSSIEALVQAVTGAGFGITVPVAALLQCDGGDILELSLTQTGSTQSVGGASLKNQFFINKVA
jgi:hypothetical protein